MVKYLFICYTCIYYNYIQSSVKDAIGKFNSNFSGYSQQDSHEFISFFLDAIHEDLNLIINKPYFECDDDIEKSDDNIKSELYWERFKLRNNSIITYYFTGQFKMEIECLDCHYKTMKFNEFNSIPLPILKHNLCEINVFFIIFKDVISIK